MNMSLFNRIPDELLVLIIGCLLPPDVGEYNSQNRCFNRSPDKQHVVSASMSSRRWRACALPSLFRDVVFHHYPAVISTPTAVLRSIQDTLLGIKNMKSLLDFLQNHPDICPYVQRLSLRLGHEWSGKLRKFAHVLDWNLALDVHVDHTILLDVVGCLPSLRTLSIIDLTFSPPSSGVRLLNIETLYLGLSSRTTDVMKNLSSFAHVRNLHLVLPVGGAVIGASDLPDGAMRNLSVRSFFAHEVVRMQPFTDAFRCGKCATSLNTLSIGYALFPSILADTREFLDTFSSNIVDLECALKTYDNGAAFVPSSVYDDIFNSVPWPLLRNLTLHFRLIGTGDFAHEDKSVNTNRAILPRLASILRTFSATCPALSTVSLVIEGSPFVVHDLWRCVPECIMVEEALLSFPAVRTVRLLTGEVWDDFGRSEQAAIRDALTILAKTDILQL